MSSILIVIKLDGAEGPYQPAEMLQGEFHLANRDATAIRAAECSVLWHTFGKGDEDYQVVELQRWASRKDEVHDWAAPHAFSFELPDHPLSYEGIIVQVRWCVRVRVFSVGGMENVAEMRFQLGNVLPAATVRGNAQDVAPIENVENGAPAE